MTPAVRSTPSRRLSRLRLGDRERSRGTSLAEFAMVVPLLAFLLFGLLDVGRVVYINNAISEGAREGTRWGAVQGRSRSSSSRETIAARTRSVMTGVPAPEVSVACLEDETRRATCHTNDTLVVTVRTRVTLSTPAIAQLLGDFEISAQSTVAVLQ